MRALPDARLLLMVPEGRHRRRLLERLAAQRHRARARGASSPFVPRADYLRTYRAHRLRPRHLSLQRAHDQPRRTLDGRPHRDPRRRDLRRPRGIEPASSAGPHRSRRVHGPGVRRYRRRARQRPAEAQLRCERRCARGSRALRSWMARASRGTSKLLTARLGFDTCTRFPRPAASANSDTKAAISSISLHTDCQRTKRSGVRNTSAARPREALAGRTIMFNRGDFRYG